MADPNKILISLIHFPKNVTNYLFKIIYFCLALSPKSIETMAQML